MHRTTIAIPDELKSRAMRRAKLKGVSLGELIREALEAHLREGEESPRHENPFFRDRRVYTGDAPQDLSTNHDQYLYGDRE